LWWTWEHVSQSRLPLHLRSLRAPCRRH
jgi:hypothetical protein